MKPQFPQVLQKRSGPLQPRNRPVESVRFRRKGQALEVFQIVTRSTAGLVVNAIGRNVGSSIQMAVTRIDGWIEDQIDLAHHCVAQER